ncbi:MAG: DUF169 domain-containing protein [Methanobrevibacter sp.]|nr:DUF169 domain-containing protein [Methanobrevibacter sp.]
MEFNIVNELNGQFDPIVLIKTNEKPDDALAPKAGRGGCVMSFVAQTIAKRKITAFGRENITCGGVSAGFGWGTGFKTDEDREFQASFLSLGLDSAKDKDAFLKRLGYLPEPTQKMFKKGERIFSDFDTAYENIKNRPFYDEGQYVVFKPIESLEEGEIPDSVIFTLNAMELSAVLQLNSSFRVESAHILTPQASACQAIGAFTFEQADSDNPVPILSPIDFAARAHVRRLIPDDYMNLSMPWELFLKLEELSKNSVFQTHFWGDFGNK